MGLNKIKTLFIAHSGDGYGANRSLLDILCGLDRDRFELYLIAGSRGFVTEKAAASGIPVYIERFRRWTRIQWYSPALLNFFVNVFSAIRIAILARRLNIALIYTNTGGVLSGALAARLAGIKHIWHVREAVSERPFEFKIIDRLSDLIIANSQATRERFAEAVQPKIKVVYNDFQVPPKMDIKERAAAKSRAGFNDQIILTIVGNIYEKKGQKEAVMAMPEILKRFPRTKLVIVGQSYGHTHQYESEVRGLISSLHISENVLMLGFKENMSEIYGFTDILLVASQHEAFGRAIVEAMLHQVPVVATNVGGIPEIIEHGKTGVLLKDCDPHSIAQGVIHLLENPGERATMAEAGRDSVAGRFAMAKTISEIEKYLVKVVGQNGGGPRS